MAQWGLLETSMWVNIQRITGVPHCANVVWPDLEPERVEHPVGPHVGLGERRQPVAPLDQLEDRSRVV